MKILVIYATAGAGHRKAAEAVYEGIKAHTEHEVVLIDSLDYTNKFYKKFYSQGYTFVVTYAPWLWGFLFELIDLPFILPLVRLAHRLQNFLNAEKLADYFIEQDFDYIITTHFFPCEVSSYLKRKGVIRSKVICSVTDYDVHNIWLSKGVDTYLAATDLTARRLKEYGIAEQNIAIVGIPTNEKFSSHNDINALKERLGLLTDEFTVLVATGSFGIGPIEEIVQRVMGCQILVVCGHNKELYNRLKPKENDIHKIFGLVNNMDELMAVSDVMVSKPGGLSISEALVSQLPLIFFNAIPGQETNNIQMLNAYGVGHNTSDVREIARVVEDLRKDAERLEAEKARIKSLAKPHAVKDIISLLQ